MPSKARFRFADGFRGLVLKLSNKAVLNMMSFKQWLLYQP
ncbi:hypothetical protein EV11_1096 [Prochlorococcus sp. SS52]|nr:hypothetical protein EV04_0020 [Prochlorococcus marinus str. LG]KGG22567.1 hypothetical protein EV08_0082 [Prochlorococcus marinus str. SS2]KGG24410.1 hypothetical protein EV09_0317 [Prochlorococcus marinus str. SS35]KGG34183.1 hypothetical protein EV10_0029 [Prochlorococcus marinus str. SS51]KGG35822.1 hypothetical protein EV11_1096 [Prochlorococcus sp. SS52]